MVKALFNIFWFLILPLAKKIERQTTNHIQGNHISHASNQGKQPANFNHKSQIIMEPHNMVCDSVMKSRYPIF
jgi:hypothetical protein